MLKFRRFFIRLGFLAAIATFFYASYGFANYFANRREFVPEIVFEWEFAIPFWAWTIVPYWSLNLLYGLGFLLCKDIDEVKRYFTQLFLAQIIAIFFFVFFPLQISWQKPQTNGFFGFLFSSLAAFDKPFNQAPSLHIILCVIVGSLYIGKSSQIWLKAVVFAWFVLITACVLTTFQHHFIDIPTGLIVGFLVLWLVPLNGETMKCALLNRTKRHFKWMGVYGSLALLTAFLALNLGGAYLWILYFSLSFFILVLGYGVFGARVFRKLQNGELEKSAKILLLPYLYIARLNALFWLRDDTKSVQILPHIYLGSILDASKFEVVLDLTAEFEYRPNLGQIYSTFALLDMVTPRACELNEGAKRLDELANLSKDVLLCCALGYGRSAAVLITWLIKFKYFSYDDALNLVKSARPKIVINEEVRAEILKAVK